SEEPAAEESGDVEDSLAQALDDEGSQESAAEADDVAKAVLVDPAHEEATIAHADWVEAEVVGDETSEDLDVVEPAPEAAASDEFMDELEFLESLSLDDAENFDAVSAMLDEEDAESGTEEDSKRKSEDL
ncbi:MAG: hypothetical protein HKP01_01890, partial [Gemmatimonadetes bacterium]|nr:hypothetical protein [Gemmatimonadota bacterium]